MEHDHHGREHQEGRNPKDVDREGESRAHVAGDDHNHEQVPKRRKSQEVAEGLPLESHGIEVEVSRQRNQHNHKDLRMAGAKGDLAAAAFLRVTGAIQKFREETPEKLRQRPRRAI